ncbi:NUDIX domain-containing protein [Paenibacillus oralis]|uniref:NUDIX domain-containing protein n=1 Tax=Paenibacillus oralis TaxID=2490856 RepID=A0A3P3U5T6_9BACL|nr:NUDIX domain-containing protein [Paenibacillus oralis]RRJ65645.1 NUDIX domain-containing protein [Paenibacillus oralis]
MPEHIDKIAWICIKDQRILGVRSKGKELFYFPGGKREPGETDAETLQREIGEELSVRIKPETIAYYGAFEAQADGKPEGVLVKMTCYTADYSGELAPASEIAELAWLSYADLDRASLISRIIFDELYEKNLLV